MFLAQSQLPQYRDNLKSKKASLPALFAETGRVEHALQVFITKWRYPASKNEWTEQSEIDLKDFGFPVDLSEFKSLSVNSFKNSLKKKAKEFAFFNFL